MRATGIKVKTINREPDLENISEGDFIVGPTIGPAVFVEMRQHEGKKEIICIRRGHLVIYKDIGRVSSLSEEIDYENGAVVFRGDKDYDKYDEILRKAGK